MEQFQDGKDTFSMHQKKSSKLPDCPEKRTAQKVYRIYTKGKKKSNNIFATMFARRNNCKENALLTACLKLACGGGGSVYQGKIQCKLPQQCEHTGQQVFKRTPLNAVNALVTSKN